MMEEKARKFREEIVRMLTISQRGHLPSTLSCIDIFVSLYYDVMKKEDIFIVSKGHANMGLYPILVDKGLIDKSELEKYASKEGKLRMHADPSIPGIHFVGGSLGNGIGFATGCAIADRADGIKRRYYVLVGDGELYEGSVWESLFLLSKKQLPITIIVDKNDLAIMGRTEELLPLGSLYSKFEGFHLQVTFVDGHSFEEMKKIFGYINKYYSRKPFVVVAHTVKGKGIPAIEGDRLWHVKLPKMEELNDVLDSIY